MTQDQGYGVFLKDLEDRHKRCSEEIERCLEEQKMLAQMIANVRQFITFASQTSSIPSSRRVESQHRIAAQGAATPGKYSGLSVRWAILFLLSEAVAPMGTAEIADALTKGGVHSNAQRFVGNVSAILSGMVKERGEVVQEESGYSITPHGRDVWDGIKRTPQWLRRDSLDTCQ